MPDTTTPRGSGQTSWLREIVSAMLGYPLWELLSKLFDKAGQHVTDKEMKTIFAKLFGPNTEDERRFHAAMALLDPNEQRKIWEMLNQLDSHQNDYFRIAVMQETPEKIADVLRNVYVHMNEETWKQAVDVMNFDLEQIQDKWQRLRDWVGEHWEDSLLPWLINLGWTRGIGLALLIWFLARTTPAQVGQGVGALWTGMWTKYATAGGWAAKALAAVAKAFASAIAAVAKGLWTAVTNIATGLGKGISWGARMAIAFVRVALAVVLLIIGGALGFVVLSLIFPTFGLAFAVPAIFVAIGITGVALIIWR